MKSSKLRQFGQQVKQFAARFVQSTGQAILGQVIPVDELEQWIREEVGEHRERTYPPLRTLMLFIEQVMGADHSCQDAVARGASQEVACGEVPRSLNTGAYCKARKRLPLALVQRLSRTVAARMSERQPKEWKWRGREVKLVDGTTVSMPDTADNRKGFPLSNGQTEGLSFPLARLVGVVSLSCATVVDWAMGPYTGKQTGEAALLWTLRECFKPGDVVIADRLYASYFVIAWLMLLGVDVVMRQHQTRDTDFRRGKRLGARDHVVEWERPSRPAWMDDVTYAGMPESLTMREVRTGGWTLVTTLTDAKVVSKPQLLDLYRSRWHVELDFRSIKDSIQMNVLRCESANMVRKEVAVHLLAYNLVRSVTAQAATLARVLPRCLSFKAALQTLNAFMHTLRDCPARSLPQRHAILLTVIARLLIPKRPGRVEPRAVKRRPKPHRLLTKPRHVERARLEKRQRRVVAAFA